jgi:xylulokinase
MMAAIGVGAVMEGPVVVSLGTSGTGFAYRPQPAVDPRGEASAFCDSTGGWLPLATILNCTVATEWVARLFGLDHAQVDAAVNGTPPGARGISFLPYLEGERTPNHPTGAGLFAGLRAEHVSADIVRAVMEGVTFGLKYAVAALERSGVRPSRLTLVGGGASSDAWAQLCADIFELPVIRSTQVEAAAAGAARQARWIVDGVAAKAEADAGRRFEPSSTEPLREAGRRADRLREVALQESL